MGPTGSSGMIRCLSGAGTVRAGGWARVAIVAALVAGLAPSTARGSPLELYGFGGRSPALAGTGESDAAGFDSTYLNPAGLGEVKRKRLSVGYLYGDFALELDGDDTGTDRPRGLSFGAALPLPLGGALADRVGLGIGVLVPTGTLTRVRVPLPGDPVYALLETRSQTLGILVATGVRLSDRWRAGIGLLALAALRGYIFVDVDAAKRFSTDSEQRIVTNFAPIAGVTWDPPMRGFDQIRFGLTVRGASRSDYDIEVTNDLASELPLSLPPLRIAGVAQYDPWTVDLETSWRATGALTAYALLSFQHWSDFPLPTENPLATAPAQEEPKFHDTLRPHVGAELKTGGPLGGDLALRAGYAFLMTPAPEMKTRQSLLDNHRHLFSAGVGLAWPDSWLPLHLDAWFQLHQLQPRSHQKDPDAFGPDMPLPFDSIATKGRIVVGGLTAGVDL
ncbi:MAG TPA: outer membrane protein transport protein [Kofleriaceae bacterium]